VIKERRGSSSSSSSDNSNKKDKKKKQVDDPEARFLQEQAQVPPAAQQPNFNFGANQMPYQQQPE